MQSPREKKEQKAMSLIFEKRLSREDRIKCYYITKVFMLKYIYIYIHFMCFIYTFHMLYI